MDIYGNYEVTVNNSSGGNILEMILGGFIAVFAVIVIMLLLMVIAQWKIFKKAGKPGWYSLIPIYNQIMLLEICGLPVWYFVLYMIPLVNIYVFNITNIKLAKKFNKGTGFIIGLLFATPIFYIILGFGKVQYSGGSSYSGYTNTTYNTTPSQNKGVNNNQIIRCNGCGKSVKVGTAFCTSCGKKI
ncbi:MAG: DUF5684 domain-containing protein [Bacilli bacterium]